MNSHLHHLAQGLSLTCSSFKIPYPNQQSHVVPSRHSFFAPLSNSQSPHRLLPCSSPGKQFIIPVPAVISPRRHHHHRLSQTSSSQEKKRINVYLCLLSQYTLLYPLIPMVPLAIGMPCLTPGTQNRTQAPSWPCSASYMLHSYHCMGTLQFTEKALVS